MDLILDGNGGNIGGGYDGNNYRYFTTCNGIVQFTNGHLIRLYLQ